MQGSKSTPPEVRPHTITPSIPNSEAQPVMPRRVKLGQEDFIEFGYTIGCPGCESIQMESNVRRGHSETCRKIIEEELSKTGRGKDKLERANARIDEKVAEMGEQAMQDMGEIAPDITELVD